jgi:23S rRNA pseudouridine2605 synthase
MERLQKVMAHAGVASRRRSEEIILQGRVKVNGRVASELGIQVSSADIIEVDGKVISSEKKVYIMLNKPVGYITTVDDPHNRKTVLDLTKEIPQRIYPVGRLDYDTSGLLLLTNDGELTYILTHPSHMVDKTYLVEIEGWPGRELGKLEKGILLEDGITAPARVEGVRKEKETTSFRLTIHEGRNRQVRRMCAAIGHQVKKLRRIRFASLDLMKLPPGKYRHLKKEEIEKLKELL